MAGRPVKYDLDYVRREAHAFLQYVSDTPDCFFIDEFIVTRDYHPNRWAEWMRDFGEDEEFSGAVKKGERQLEMRLVKLGLQGKLNPTMVIFVTANKYGYTRKDREYADSDQPLTGADIAALAKEAVSATAPGAASPDAGDAAP